MLQKSTEAKNKIVEAEGLESIQLAVMASRDDKGINTTSLAKNLSEINGLTDINNSVITEDTAITLPKSVKLNNVKYKIKEDGTVIMNNSILPDEYQKIKYIESSGKQYINTKVSPYGIYTYRWTGILSKTNALWGSYQSGKANSGTLYMGKVYCFGESTIELPSEIFGTISTGEVIMNFDTLKTTVKVSNFEKELAVQNGNYPTQAIYLFAQANPNGGAEAFSTYKLNNFQMIINNVTIKNFIPCYSTTAVTDVNGKQCSAGTIGMYDTVEGKFYTNQGTGTFGYETEDGTYVEPTNN